MLNQAWQPLGELASHPGLRLAGRAGLRHPALEFRDAILGDPVDEITKHVGEV